MILLWNNLAAFLNNSNYAKQTLSGTSFWVIEGNFKQCHFLISLYDNAFFLFNFDISSKSLQ